MTTLEKINKIRGLLDEYEEKIQDWKDDVMEEVKENIKSEVEDMGDDSDLIDFINDNCGGDIHLMEEHEFNDYMRNQGYSSWNVLEFASDLDVYDSFFGEDSSGCLKSSCDLSEFIDLDDVVTELIDYDEDLGNSTIRNELDRLDNPEEDIEQELLSKLKELLGIEDNVESVEVKQESNEDLEKVIDWIYEHKMLGEDFDNKFPNLADKYKEKEC